MDGQSLLLLIGAHLLIWRKFYFMNSFCYATSEALEQGFACSRLLGTHLRTHGLWTLKGVDDPYYYPDHSGLPFLSTYYPIHRVQAWVSSFLPLNSAWWLYSATMVSHCLFSAIACYMAFHQIWTSDTAIFGAIMCSCLPYAMKQNSCIVYTHSWLVILAAASLTNNTVLYGISFGMALLAGYWPLVWLGVPISWVLWFSVR